MKRIYWKFRIVLLALRWPFTLCLGDIVEYQGKRWYLANGPCAPSWTLRRQGEEAFVHESEFRKVRSLKNYWHDFTFGYRFYCTIWLDILVRDGVLPWMQVCNIWAGKRPLATRQPKEAR